MSKILQLQTISLLLIIFLFNEIHVAQETGGPYIADNNTILLMHFNDDLNFSGNYTGNVVNWGETAIYDPSTDGFDNCLRINNSSSLQCVLMDVTPEFDLGSDWTVEFWIKIGNYGSGAAEFPSIFIKDGYGITALTIGFRNDGLGFTGSVTLSDQSELWINQTTGIDFNKWHHVAFVSNSAESKISLIVHDENWFMVFNESRSFPEGHDGTLCDSDRQMFLGGVDGSSNIQFDGWIDEFRVSNTARDFSNILPELPPLQGQTENIEFYSNPEDAGNWTAITQSLQYEYNELSSFWNRPGKMPIIPAGTKIKMYLLNRADFLQYAGTQLPDWKCGWFDHETYTVTITKPVGSEQDNYYTSFEALAKGTLAQLMSQYHLVSTGINSAPFYFLEGFGLYRGGYRPDRELILQAINDLGRLPNKTDIENSQEFTTGYLKDLIVSYIECQLFNGIAYQSISTWMGNSLWHPYFQYFYQPDDNERIMIRQQSENFDIYCTAQDEQFLEQIKNRLEEKLSHYENCYQMAIQNRFNIVIFPNEATGMACMGYGDHYNGGSGCGGDKLDILSPVFFGGGIDEALYSLIPHEFMHVFHNHMTPDPSLITGFYTEGLAEVMAYEGENLSYLQNRDWYFREGLERFNQENGRDPKLEDIMPDSDGYLSVYSYGQAFWYYMLQNHADYVDIKEFFSSSNDWSVFSDPYDVIDAGYIDFLRSIAGLSTNVDDIELDIPIKFILQQNYPNPFNPSTTISFQLPSKCEVVLKIYDVIGREIAELINNELKAGTHNIDFYAYQLSSGIYFYTLHAGNLTQSKKMLLLK